MVRAWQACVGVQIVLAAALASSLEGYRKGMTLLAQGHYDQARRELRKAMIAAESEGEHGEELGQILDAFGRAEFAAGRYAAAKKLFDRALKLPAIEAGTRAGILGNASQVRLALGESRRPEEYLREAIRLRPDVAGLWHLLGQALFRQGKLAEAEAAYQKALSDSALAPVVWSDIANLLEAQDQRQRAIVLMRHALNASAPGQPRARILRNLAMFEWKAGHRQSAMEHLGGAVRELQAAVGPDHPDLAVMLDDYSEILASTGNRAASRQAAQRAKSIRSAFAGQDGTREVDWRDLRP